MRASSTRALSIVVGVIAVLASPCLAIAQNVSVDPVSVRMPDDATGVDVKAVVAIAIRLGVPLGFEEAGALAERVRGPIRPSVVREKPIVSVRPTPLDVRGVTLRQALDAVITKDRRYAWRMLDGVVVVRPVAAWNDATHPLDETLLNRLDAMVRTRARSHWVLASERSLVLLDRGRAVEVSEPVLRLRDDAGEETIPLPKR